MCEPQVCEIKWTCDALDMTESALADNCTCSSEETVPCQHAGRDEGGSPEERERGRREGARREERGEQKGEERETEEVAQVRRDDSFSGHFQ